MTGLHTLLYLLIWLLCIVGLSGAVTVVAYEIFESRKGIL